MHGCLSPLTFENFMEGNSPMTMKPITTLLAACAAALLFSACGGDKSDKTTVEIPPPVINDPTLTEPSAVNTEAPVAETTATEQTATPTPAPTATPTPQLSPTPPMAADETTPTTAMQPPSDVRAAITPAPTPVVDPATPPAEAIATVRETLRTIDPLAQPRLSAEKEALLRANMLHVMRKAEEPDAYPKDTREGITELAGKIAYQFEEARNSPNADTNIQHLKRAEELLVPLEEALSGADNPQ